MSHERLIMAIGRIERALSRLERTETPSSDGADRDVGLSDRHEKLKAETRMAMREIDALITQGVR